MTARFREPRRIDSAHARRAPTIAPRLTAVLVMAGVLLGGAPAAQGQVARGQASPPTQGAASGASSARTAPAGTTQAGTAQAGTAQAGTAQAGTAPLGTAPQWARIPAGTFQMGCVDVDAGCDGDEVPQRVITMSRPFEMMTTEVTTGMFRAATGDLPEQPEWSTDPRLPVVIVSWFEAADYCRAVGARLPSEAEWEYAARGGDSRTVFPWGNQDAAHETDAASGARFEGGVASVVGSYRANAFGLFDMAGNVWEWVNDRYGAYDENQTTNPVGGNAGDFRIVRGGSYGDDQRNLRISNRNPVVPEAEHVNLGFRCARDVAP
ncbi:MAG: SUMF1/EgtB/PvdO family nonheme iron enzyme [Vicinamibacterales bacterium]